MKRSILLIFLIGVVWFASCVSLQDKEMSVFERTNVEIVEQATVNFTSWQIFHIRNRKKIRNKAYLELKKVAQEKYGANADVANIIITGSWTNWEIFNIVGNIFPITGGTLIGATAGGYDNRLLKTIVGGGTGIVLSLFVGNSQKITATGDVILFNQGGKTQ